MKTSTKIIIGFAAIAAIYGLYSVYKNSANTDSNPEQFSNATGSGSCMSFCKKHCTGICTQTCEGNRCTCHCHKKISAFTF